jgi:N-acetylmuramic acid 6-phosphate etherase
MKKRKLFDQLRTLTTEKRNKNTLSIDEMGTIEILQTINREDQKVAVAVRKEIPHVEKAVNLVVHTLLSGGRLIYVGAGTSGRLGILDAAECPPTFGTSPNLIQGIIAGGKPAVFRSQEGAEDNEADARRNIRKLKVGDKDTVCGIAASLRTPFVQAALREAKIRGASTILVTTNPRTVLNRGEFSRIRKYCDVAICPSVGPEVIMGSTRMKSGSAQKMILNMITTTSMIRIGKVYQNLMVDLRMNSKKLEERAKRVLMTVTGLDYESASKTIREAGGHVKTAIVMVKSRLSRYEAKHRLKKADGFVKKAIGEVRK